ncbi:MAG: sugar phosphate isomerase/epimerase [Elusimicrobia bacterium]|nr:sugar phosphate isomerase/epimerase [Elusimicrobiota bacterium]
MKLGRNFTNTLIAEVLDEGDRQKIISGELDLFSLNALGLLDFKRNVSMQLDAAKRLGLDWLELDCDVPNPYLEFGRKDCDAIKKKAAGYGIELSIHLSYSSVGKEVACIQDYERELVVGLHRKYLDFGSMVGAKSCVLHPGTAPFYFLTPLFTKKLEAALLKTIDELAGYAGERGMKFHIENNVSFDNIYYEIDDMLEVAAKARKRQDNVYFNFDIGHWFTRAEKGKEIPEDFLKEMRKIPQEMVYEIHLNDYVPKKIIFHPPLIDTPGLLKEDVLKEYFSILKGTLKPEVVVLETAFKTKKQVAERWDFLEKETEYVRGLMK